MIKIQNKQQLIILSLVIMLGIIILISLFWASFQKQESVTTFTASEEKLRRAPSQNFMIPEPQITTPGSLIINSEPSEARVVIDAADEEGGGTSKFSIPVNITPFRVDGVPAGKHHVLISKAGFSFQELDVEIKPGEITRLSVQLAAEVIPQPSAVDWKSKLPINESTYSITYDQSSGIIVTMKISASNAESAQEEAQNLSDEIKNKMESIGIPTSSEKITWNIE